MDLQEYFNAVVSASRKQSLAKSPQLTLGELILKLESIIEKLPDEKKVPSVIYDFGTAVPSGLSSWRGSYEELALGYELTGYDVGNRDFDEVKLDRLLQELKGAIGTTYTGWKGGDFVMHRHTPVWVANPGNSGNTGIVGVLNLGYTVVLLTAYCEF